MSDDRDTRCPSIRPIDPSAPPQGEARGEYTCHRARGVGIVLALLVLVLIVAGRATAAQPSERLAKSSRRSPAGLLGVVRGDRRRVARRRRTSEVAPGAVAYYDSGADQIRFGPLACTGQSAPLHGRVTPTYVAALFVAAHEAAHAAGIEDEAIANCWALYWAQDLARRFHGIRFFTPASRLVLNYARHIQRDSPPDYRAACPV